MRPKIRPVRPVALKSCRSCTSKVCGCGLFFALALLLLTPAPVRAVECGRKFATDTKGFLYCTLNLEGATEQTNYCLADADPRWGDEFVLLVKQKMSCLELMFYSVDEEGAATTFVGEINIPIHTLPSHKLVTEWFPLSTQTTGAAVQVRCNARARAWPVCACPRLTECDCAGRSARRLVQFAAKVGHGRVARA